MAVIQNSSVLCSFSFFYSFAYFFYLGNDSYAVPCLDEKYVDLYV